ncbi:pyridoxal phosphate-dependent aminotransferase [Legionella longbeachae]|uniref:Aminotransferase n=1 Tax=Legionella longbeachae serogroup 1 (strain NSW150) TaxID=661367 RepID=D3HMW3_LEGLN|nr:pyridoxal phosphate-dependent aminotransferase [Legionella longbeachae]VEE04315.1 aspartate aminotransferase [Legionella oakridgensis]HBD7397085.1 pyridoxal phosphate-dependent aminotransferase [Legionella pneumophila]ARB92862.1 pyridoxal phosphate-dependent aminotransferase [Legionella longbeachae]EEZ96786.1 aspartate aminotransferase A [Legionella longbeachae D-4968]QIN33899.1 aminotransferase class I/II-fold pyridoxal phosphate-dependent enzyme [Legionella longbeachae]
MNIALATRVQKVKPSPTLAVAAKAIQMRAQGHDVINLGTGEPDFDTPDYIKEAAILAIQQGYTKYTAVDGIPELKEAIKNKFKKDNGLDYQLNQILVSVGGKQSCYNLCQALLNSGDEVIIPAPYWVSYPDMVLLADATPVFISTTPAQRYKFNAQQLEKAITPKTRLIFLNSPSNPSGVAYTLEELKALAEVLKKHPQIVIATDDMYEHILWSQPFANILNACPELYERTIVLNGVSKAYAMTGWRIGYAAGPASLINAMKTIQSQSTSNPCSIAQRAAVAALKGGHESVLEMVKAFHQRHDFVASRLQDIPGIEVIPADGTFYIFPSVQAIIEKRGYANDLEFSEKLLTEAGVALVPGSAFGNEGCIRLSFATSMETLQDALNRLQNFCK